MIDSFIPNEILENKRNTFNHILYEIKMYLATYDVLFNPVPAYIYTPFLKNVFLECYAIHLRNLTDFFLNNTSNDNRNKDSDIVTSTIFSNTEDLDYKDTDGEINRNKRLINKSIAHLTNERTENGFTYKYNSAIYALTVVLIPKIKKCVELLSDKTYVKDQYFKELENKEIQDVLAELRTRLEINL